MTAPISSAMNFPQASAAEQSRLEMQSKLNGLSGASRLSEEAKAKKLREACEGFESIFIQKMWQEMRNTIPKGGMMHSQQERIWQDMYDQELSKSMTSAGGIGLADMMYEQLSRNLVSASRSAAGMAQGAAFTPAAAPLLPEPRQTVAENSAAPAAPSSIYEGEAPQTGQVENSSSPAPASPAQEPRAQAAPQNQAVQPAAAPAPAAAQPVSAPQQPAAAPQAAVAQVSPQPENGQAVKPAQHARPHKKSSRHYPSGPDLAQIAKRDAGDKLGARAVRPALRPQREEHPETVAQPQPETQPVSAPQPGSPEALRVAMELARSGMTGQPGASAVQLNDIVSRLQARNAAAAAQPAAEQTGAGQVVASAEQAEPARKVTRITTNIPKRSRNVKNGKQASNAIRMLNVDNVGVNSKAGQGIAAYHAARDAGENPASVAPVQRPAAPAAPVAPAQPQTMAAAPAGAPIPPLTAQAAQNSAEQAPSFAIPPLTAGSGPRQ